MQETQSSSVTFAHRQFFSNVRNASLAKAGLRVSLTQPKATSICFLITNTSASVELFLFLVLGQIRSHI